MELAILLITVFVLLVIGSPVTVALGVGSLIFILMEGTPSVVVLHRMVSGIDSFPLIAVPFFILAGHLMNSAGITTRIFGFAKALVGWMHGGLGHVNIGASIIFAGMSGAAVADAGGLRTIEIKAMRDAGYDDDFSVGITAASSTIGPIIPPSLPLSRNPNNFDSPETCYMLEPSQFSDGFFFRYHLKVLVDNLEFFLHQEV